MSGNSKREYLNLLRNKYKLCRTRVEKSKIVDELVKNFGVHRKSAIRSLNSKPRVRRGRKKRSVVYGFDLIKPLKEIWEASGKPCSKRFKPQIPEMIKKMEQFNEITLYDNQKELLSKMSTSTIDNLLVEKRIEKVDKGLFGTRTSPLLKQLIPVRTNFDDVHEPGHIETDCVLNCGESLTGTYAETLNLLDIDTHWNEMNMFLKKTNEKVIASFHRTKSRFSFKVKSIDFDNGFEFVNWKMYKYC